MRKERGKSGFTLMEMLIVIALMGILIGIGIPVFNSAMEKSRADNCGAKCIALANEANSAVMMDTGLETAPDDNDPLSPNFIPNRPLEGEDAAEKAIAALGALPDNYKNICPSGGDIGIITDLQGNINLVCSKHGAGVMQYFDPVNSIESGFKTLKANNANISTRIDSTAKIGPNTTAMYPYLPSMGSHNIATWSVKNSTESDRKKRTMQYIVWSDIDISVLPNNYEIPLMRYNVSEGTYEVWTTKVQTHTEKYDTGNDTYKRLDQGGNMKEYRESAAETDVGKLTFDQALEWYDKAKEEYYLRYPDQKPS